MKPWVKRSMWLVAISIVVALFVRALQSPPVRVDVATAERGTLVITVDDDGRTRLRDRYVISAPCDGWLLRPPLKAGAAVRAKRTELSRFQPRAPELLDARAQAEAEARVERAAAALERARAMCSQRRAGLRYARADLERRTELLECGSETEHEMDRAERDEHLAAEGLRAAQLAVRIAEHELDLARAGFVEDPDEHREPMLLRSPIDGHVIRVFEESSRTIPAGTPILEVGNTAALEVVADFLSQDAVKVRPGMEVLVEGWGGDRPGAEERVLRATVRLLEPGGFTKVSALGVEEQRVNVVMDPSEPAEGWNVLKDGYRVELRIVIREKDDVLLVPTGALFREKDTWAVFVVTRGYAEKREVSLGERNGLEAEVLGGIERGEQVVLYPSELIEDGASIEPIPIGVSHASRQSSRRRVHHRRPGGAGRPAREYHRCGDPSSSSSKSIRIGGVSRSSNCPRRTAQT